ncbi:efflux transporter outer membrane subunit [Pseudomonas borbori]|uniref:Outer membrane protein, multidrug efflux system n=1 Tax=Pseudomonas borbori TaxID=289003 RepID=A0A1I5RTS5_9PSED|nr:efflux transporter outer membrane subunit [Pseudomonas borbori]SFP61969.1 outer membrane protein, multidrug efflux system [Pseudomonas borbori]
MKGFSRRPLVTAMMLSGSLLVGGCMVGPDYQRPPLDMPSVYKEPAATDPAFVNLDWWELFADQRLDALIEEALAYNRDLGVAISRIEEAAAILRIERANQYPFIDAAAGAGRSSPSRNILPTAETESSYFFNGAASFEVDLWGKLRRSTEAARADLLSTEASARNVTISLIAAVATTYFQLLDLDDRLRISVRTLQSREDALEIIKERYAKGTVPELDVNQAEIEAADAQASVAAFERSVRQTENALSVLVGSRPRLIERGEALARQTLPVEVPAGLPLTLLERRPDIVTAEQQLAAETARIGVARALRLPSLSLTASFGYASRDLSDLVEGDSESWGVFGDILAPIFNAGQLKSVEEAQRQRAEQARLGYEQAVLNGLRDVDDSLTGLRTSRAEYIARQRQLEAARTAARLSRARYDGGLVSYLEVLDSDRSLFQAELLESQTRQQQLSAVVGLYRALGGGWPAAQAQ